MFDVKEDLVSDFRAFGCFRSLSHEKESDGQDDHKRDHNSLDVSHLEEHWYQMVLGRGCSRGGGPIAIEQAAKDTYSTRK